MTQKIRSGFRLLTSPTSIALNTLLSRGAVAVAARKVQTVAAVAAVELELEVLFPVQ